MELRFEGCDSKQERPQHRCLRALHELSETDVRQLNLPQLNLPRLNPPQSFDHVLMNWKLAILLLLGKDGLTFRDHVKDAASSSDQFRFKSKLFQNVGRQTGSLGLVVSLSAVSNGYLHRKT